MIVILPLDVNRLANENNIKIIKHIYNSDSRRLPIEFNEDPYKAFSNAVKMYPIKGIYSATLNTEDSEQYLVLKIECRIK